MKKQDVQKYIEEIKRQLHLGHASLMVGCGFSKNAEVRSSFKNLPPNWNELKTEFIKRIYDKYTEQEIENKSNSKTVLQLAYEYEKMFDRSSLNKFIGEHIQNSNIFPGELHKQLLKLPWRDVFTTNYDTLLERAAEDVVDRKYDTVRYCRDLAFSESPRIIKLHGSLESEAFHLIVTEEDYRTYPNEYAPFVNTVQQAITETTLCLIGFSGTDPNFIKWIGWVRDNLKDSMPPIYLIDKLDLSISEYNVLIEQNIKPVDLSLLGGKDYKELFQKFFDEIKTNDPIEWDLSTSEEERHLLSSITDPKLKKREKRLIVDKLMQIWKRQREQYPNWLVMPNQYRQEMMTQTEYWTETFKTVLKHSIFETKNINWLYEYNWRIEHCLLRIPSDYIENYETILKHHNPLGLNASSFFDKNAIVTKDKPNSRISVAGKWIELMFAILRWYREEHLEQKFKSCANILKRISKQYPAYTNKVYYEKVLFAQSLPNMKLFVKTMRSWSKVLSSPEWHLKYISLFAETGNIDGVEAKLKETLLKIRQLRPKDTNRKDYYSLWLEGVALAGLTVCEQGRSINQIAIVQSSTKANSSKGLPILSIEDLKVEKPYQQLILNDDEDDSSKKKDNKTKYKYTRRLDELKAIYCDPRDEPLLSQLSTYCPAPYKVNKPVQKRVFDRNITQYHSYYQINKDELTGFQLIRYLEETGVLQHLGVVSIYDKQLLNAAKCIAPTNSLSAFSVFNRIGTKDNSDFDLIYDLYSIYKTPQGEIDRLTKLYVRELRWALKNVKGELVKPTNNVYKKLFFDLIESLSRLVVRVSQSFYQELFDLLIELFHAQISKSYNETQFHNFTRRLLGAMPSDLICNNLERLLRIELPNNGNDARFWTNPFSYIALSESETKAIQSNDSISSALDIWLERLDSSDDWKQSIAFIALVIICDWGIMNSSQKKLYAEKVFSILNDSGLPSNTNYYPWVFLKVSKYIDKQDHIAKCLLKYYTKYDFSSISSSSNNQQLSLEVTSYSILVNLSLTHGNPHAKLEINSRDAMLLFSHISRAVKDFFMQLNTPTKKTNQFIGANLDNNLLLLDRVISEVIVPRIIDKKDLKEIASFLSDIEKYHPFPSSQCAMLCSNDAFPYALTQRFIVAISSADRDFFNVYSWAILNSYIRAKKLLGPVVPPCVFSSLLTAVGMKSDDTFQLICQNIVAILDFYEMNQQERDLLLHYLECLKNETCFFTNSSRFPFESRYDYRIAACELAARVFKTFSKSTSSIPKILSEWEIISHSSPEFSSLRSKWDKTINYAE